MEVGGTGGGGWHLWKWVAPLEVGGTGGSGWHRWEWVAPWGGGHRKSGWHQKRVGEFSPSAPFEGTSEWSELTVVERTIPSFVLLVDGKRVRLERM